MNVATSHLRIRVLILEEHRLIRESLPLMLEAKGMEVVGAHGQAEEFLQAAWRPGADVALVDIGLEDLGGDDLSVLQALRGIAPAMRVVVLSGLRNPDLAERAYRMGACAYLHKRDTDCAGIVTALWAASRGERFADSRTFEDEFRRLRARDREGDPLATLTGRERDVLAWLASGADNLKIAAVLDIAERTVRAHVSSLYRKLERENRTELAIFARDVGVRPRH